jgi:hypothetical protein
VSGAAPPAPRRFAGAGEHVAALALFTILTIALTWPAAPLFWRGVNAFGDVVLQMTALTWDAHALTTNPLGVFEAPFFYPYAHSNAYSEHLIGETLIALPLFWLTNGDPAPAHNFNFLISFVLSAYGAYLLTRDLTGNRVAAVAAGIAFGFNGYRFVQSGHLNVLATQWFPLTLWALRRGLRWNHGGYLALAAAFGVCMGLFSVYFVYFLAITVALYGLWWLLVGRRPLPGAPEQEEPALDAAALAPPRRVWPLGLKVTLAALLGGLALLPFYWPYVQVNAELGLARSVYEAQSWAAHPSFFWNVLPTNWLWATLLPDLMVSNRGERQLFPGLLITLLAVLGLLLGGRRARAAAGAPPARPAPFYDGRERSFYLLLGVVAVLLTFGVSVRLPGLNWDVPLPYGALYQWAPGFAALRVPVRFVVLLDLALAVLGGYGLTWLLARRPRWAPALWLPLLALLTLEYVQVRDLRNNRDMRPASPQPYTWLASHPGPVVELPMGGGLFSDVWYTYWATYDWQPLVSGAGSFMPPGTVEIARAMAAFPDPASVALLQGLEIRHVVVHLGQYAPTDARALKIRLDRDPALKQAFRQGDDVVYELAADPWAARIAAALPAPGALWLGRGAAGGAPALEALAYALKYERLADARLPAGAQLGGDLPLGERALPPLPFGRAPDLVLLPTGDPAGGLVAGSPVYSNALATLYARDPALLAQWDLTAPNAPAAPRGLAIPPGGARFAPPAAPAGATGADLLLAAFAPTDLTVNGARVALAPGLTRYRAAVAAPLDLRLSATGAGGPPLLLRASAYGGAPPAPATQALTSALVVDLAPSALDTGGATISTAWRIVLRQPGAGAFTLSLDVYQKPFGTHPDGHLGSWSLPLSAGGEGRSYAMTLNPVAKTATATLNGAPEQVFAWQGPPHGGDFSATLNILAGDRLLERLPVYDFTIEDGRISGFSPAPGAVIVAPFAPK